VFWVSDLRRVVIHFANGFSHGLPFQLDAICVVDDAIQNSVGKRRLPDDVVPRFDGQLAGDHGRAAGVSLFDNLHQIPALRGREPVWPPVVEDQQLCFRYAAEQAGEAAVTMGQFKLLKEAGHPLVDHSDAVAAGRLREGAAKPGFTDATGAGNDQVAPVGDPSAGKQALE